MASYIKANVAGWDVKKLSGYQERLAEIANDTIEFLDPTTFHVTLTFFGKDAIPEEQAKRLRLNLPTWGTQDVYVQGPTLFTNDKGNDWVVKLDVLSTPLEDYRRILVGKLAELGQAWDNTFDFHPHITLGFVKKHSPKWLAVKTPVLLLPFRSTINLDGIEVVNN